MRNKREIENNLNTFLVIVREMVNSNTIPTNDGIIDLNSKIYKDFFNMFWNEKIKKFEIEKEKLLTEIEDHFLTKPDETKTHIHDYSLPDWLQSSQTKNPETRFNNYKKYLVKKGMSNIINQLDYDLINILNKCHNPNISGIWDRRGLVYGHVQSGKTANYVGLINRAFDHGYKIVIVLTGMTEDLRKQTQERVDMAVKTLSNDKINRGTNVGAEDMSGDVGKEILKSLLANISYKEKSIWVIKKNKTVLETLIVWVHEQIKKQGGDTLSNCPFLIIDDEADNASIQSLSKKDFEEWEIAFELQKKEEDELTDKEKEIKKQAQEKVIKAINRNIRALLSLIDQKTFVGYTATPYNIVVQEYEDIDNRPITIKHPISKTDIKLKITAGDLFPEHFIVPINPGKTYLGIERLFNENDNKNIPAVINLSKKYNRENYDSLFPSKRGEEYAFNVIPKSLQDSLYHYLVSIIIKNYRGIEEHNTMLIHTSHLTKNADYTAKRVEEFVSKIRKGVIAGDQKFLIKFNEVLNKIKKESKNPLYNKYFNLKPIFPEKIEQNEIVNVLRDNNNSSFEIISYHSSKDLSLEHKYHVLNYSEKKADNQKGNKYTNYVVIGGNRLSRGLTLEGLIVSYFIRSSTRQDSLYQMGRWFGYRSGYEDLVGI